MPARAHNRRKRCCNESVFTRVPARMVKNGLWSGAAAAALGIAVQALQGAVLAPVGPGGAAGPGQERRDLGGGHGAGVRVRPKNTTEGAEDALRAVEACPQRPAEGHILFDQWLQLHA